MPVVSIVVACRNERANVEACLRSILAQDFLAEAFEVIVADGMSDDGTRDVLQRMTAAEPRVRIIDNPGRIVSTGLNAAIRVARGDIIIRMDMHTEYASDYVRRCIEVLQEVGADNVGGPAFTKGEDYIQSAICAAYHSPFAVGGARFHNTEYEGYVDTVPYGCWPRDVFDRIGLFDEELVRNQDDEFNLRLTRAGGKIWQSPRIKSWYRPRASLRALFSQYLQYGYWKVRIIRKYKLPASVRHLVPGLFILLLIMLALPSLWWSLAAWALIGILGAYALGNVGASFVTAASKGWNLFPILPFVFAVYHFAYGYRFVRGVWDFVILRRSPNFTYAKLTRPSIDSLSQ
jgi:succinoglycan biosynthesis protein ExoA